MNRTYRFEGKSVNLATVVVTAFVRLVLFVLALVVLAVSTPLTASQVTGLGFAYVLFVASRTTTLTMSD